MKIARFIKNLPRISSCVDQKLYELDPPILNHMESTSYKYVIVSASSRFTPETFIFGAIYEDGKERFVVDNWGDLPGSSQGTLSHEEALNNAGYTVESTIDYMKRIKEKAND